MHIENSAVTQHARSESPLIDDINRLANEIQLYTHGSDKYFALSLTAIVAAATLTIEYDAWVALVVLPFTLGGLLTYVTQLQTERAARIGQRDALETIARREPRYWNLVGEACLAKAVSQRRPSVKFNAVVYALAYVASCVGAFYGLKQLVPDSQFDIWGWSLVVTLLATTFALLIATRELQGAEASARAYVLAQAPRPGDEAPTGSPRPREPGSQLRKRAARA